MAGLFDDQFVFLLADFFSDLETVFLIIDPDTRDSEEQNPDEEQDTSFCGTDSEFLMCTIFFGDVSSCDVISYRKTSLRPIFRGPPVHRMSSCVRQRFPRGIY